MPADSMTAATEKMDFGTFPLAALL